MMIPYVSQKGNVRANDCGPACCLMLKKAVSPLDTTTPEFLSQVFDVKDDGTSAADLVNILKYLKLTGVSDNNAAYPHIRLVQYSKLPLAFRSDKKADFWHWILVLDDQGAYHDPYWFGTGGANLKTTKAILDAAEVTHNSAGARIPSRVYAKEVYGMADTVSNKWRPKANSGGARVRYAMTTDTPNNILGVIPVGSTVTGEQVAGTKFVKVKVATKGVAVDGVVLVATTANNGVIDAYVSTDVFEPVGSTTPTPPTPPTPPSAKPSAIGTHPALPDLPFNKRIGVHMLTSGKPQLSDYLNAGCLAFTVMDNVAAAREARDAGAAVIFRRYINHGVVPEPAAFARGMGLDANDRVIVMGINEADSISTSEIEKRFAWDKAFALEAHRIYPKCFVVIGSFSMGTPQLENPDVAKRFRETYGAFLNANASWCGINYHGYSGRPTPDFPPSQAPVIAPEWLELRFIKYAYDPAFGGLDKNVVLVNDESGVDVAGTGGFPACGYNESIFNRWYSLRKSQYEAIPQQYIYNLFQGDQTNSSWAGYLVRYLLGPISMIWRGLATRSALQEPAHYEVGERSPLPENWNPPAKEY